MVLKTSNFYILGIDLFNPEHFVCNTADKETRETHPRCIKKNKINHKLDILLRKGGCV